MECVVGNEKKLILIMKWLGSRYRVMQHKSSKWLGCLLGAILLKLGHSPFCSQQNVIPNVGALVYPQRI